MSAIIKSGSENLLDNVYIFYDFNQVRDAVLIITYFEQLCRWEKLYVYFTNNRWESESLLMYMNCEKLNWIREKLNSIFQERVKDAEYVDLDINEAVRTEPELMEALSTTRVFSQE